jgi:hypothetical protein
MNTQNNLTTGQEKKIALMQHLNEDFFIIEKDGICTIYEGDEDEQRELFREDIEGTEEAEIDANFEIFCSNNCTEVEEYDENDYNNDYMVLTDDEADEKWEESLENYLEECIYPELTGNLANYFDDEKWKRDARYDGRGHSLSSYDGNENEETANGTTYFIYRIN